MIGFKQYNWKTASGSESSVGSCLPFPFKYNNVEYDMNNLPFDLKISTPDAQNRLYSIYLYPVAGTSISLGYYTYKSSGYPLLIYNNNGEFNIDTVLISGKYRIKNSITTNYQYGSSTIITNFTVDGVRKRYFVLNGGRDFDGKTTLDPKNYFSCGFGYEYPELRSSGTRITAPADYVLLTDGLSSSAIKNEYVGKIIDFGDTPQTVPKYFKDWLDANFDYIFPYKYTIKSPDGVTLAEQGELPPIRNITLSTTGNNVNMVLTGSNGVDYTLTWSHTVPEGKTFLGLGYAATDKRASIPSGTTTAVTWDSDITVYEIYGKYLPPATTFTIMLYQNMAENNRVDKTNYLTSVGSLFGALRTECSIIKPSIIIAQESLPTFNYVYIPIFSRYYFVTGITSVNFGLWRIELSTDFLMTYKDGVKALTAIIARQENDYNDNLIDAEVPTEKQQTITYEEIPNTVLNTQEESDNHCFVVTVVGA